MSTKLTIRTSRTRWSRVSDFWGWQEIYFKLLERRWIAFCSGCSAMPCSTNWAQGSSNLKYFPNWKPFLFHTIWHYTYLWWGNLLPECDVVVAKQFTSLAATTLQINEHSRQWIKTCDYHWDLWETWHSRMWGRRRGRQGQRPKPAKPWGKENLEWELVSK